MTDLTKITTPFGLLDEETQEALKWHGGPYEIWGGCKWKPKQESTVWDGLCTYRVKPSPRKAREFGWALRYDDGTISFFEQIESAEYTLIRRPNSKIVRLIEWPKNAPLPTLPEGEE